MITQKINFHKKLGPKNKYCDDRDLSSGQQFIQLTMFI